MQGPTCVWGAPDGGGATAAGDGELLIVPAVATRGQKGRVRVRPLFRVRVRVRAPPKRVATHPALEACPLAQGGFLARESCLVSWGAEERELGMGAERGLRRHSGASPQVSDPTAVKRGLLFTSPGTRHCFRSREGR